MVIDLSLRNAALYYGCQIEDVAGRLNLVTPPETAVGIIGRNIETILNAAKKEDREEITLTGPMAVWAYLVVFHAVVHRCRAVYYEDGRNPKLLIAKHG